MRFWLKTGLFCSIWSLSLAVVAAQPRMVQGRLADFMAQQADAQPKKGSEGFMVPNPAEKMAWQRLMQAFNAQAWIRVDSRQHSFRFMSAYTLLSPLLRIVPLWSWQKKARSSAVGVCTFAT